MSRSYCCKALLHNYKALSSTCSTTPANSPDLLGDLALAAHLDVLLSWVPASDCGAQAEDEIS